MFIFDPLFSFAREISARRAVIQLVDLLGMLESLEGRLVFGWRVDITYSQFGWKEHEFLGMAFDEGVHSGLWPKAEDLSSQLPRHQGGMPSRGNFERVAKARYQDLIGLGLHGDQTINDLRS